MRPWKGHTRPYNTTHTTRSHSAMQRRIRPHMAMAVKSNNKTILGHIRPYKTTQGHTRPYKANTTIQCHNVPNVPQLHIFCSLAHFLFHCTFFLLLRTFCSLANIVQGLAQYLFDLEHFWTWFHANNKNNKASYRIFERCSRSKTVWSIIWAAAFIVSL